MRSSRNAFTVFARQCNRNYPVRMQRGFATFSSDVDLQGDLTIKKVITAFEKDNTGSIDKVAKASGVNRMHAFACLKMLRLQHIAQGKPDDSKLAQILEDVQPTVPIPPQRYPKFEVLDDLEPSMRPASTGRAKATHREVPKWKKPQKKSDRTVLGIHEMKRQKYVCVDISP